MILPLLPLYVFACHSEGEFERDLFEGYWWGMEEYPMCFNFAEDFLTYQDSVTNQGPWEFIEPNIYEIFGNKKVSVVEDEDCWEVSGLGREINACECDLIGEDTQSK